MYFKQCEGFTVEKLETGEFKVVFYGDLKPTVGEELALWSQTYKTLHDALADTFEDWMYDSTEILGRLLLGEDGLEITVDDKKAIIDDFGAEGRFTLYDTGYVGENIEVSIASVGFAKEDGYIEGIVRVDGANYPFDYNVETEIAEIHHYSNPSWLDGSSYEKELPNVVVRNFEDIDSAIYEAVQGLIEKNKAPSLEVQIKSAARSNDSVAKEHPANNEFER